MSSLLEYRQRLISFLPAACRSKSKSISHKKFWFLCIFFFICMGSIFSFLFLHVTKQFDVQYASDVFKLDKSYQKILENESNNTWLNMISSFRRHDNDFTSKIKNILGIPPYPINKSNMCIRRDYYYLEFLRLFGLNPLHLDYTLHYTLVIGSNSIVGRAVVNQLKEQNKPYLVINGTSTFDFKDQIMKKVLEIIKIKQIIICDSTNTYRHTQKNVSSYMIRDNNLLIDGLIQLTRDWDVNVSFVKLPHAQDMEDLIIDKSYFKVIPIPYFIDESFPGDPRNILINAVSECYLRNKTTIDTDIDYKISTLTSKQIGKYILENLKEGVNSPLPDHDMITVSELINYLNQTCCVTLNHDSIQNFQKKAVELPKSFDRYLKYVPQISNKPYVSIVVVGRHDGFSKGFEKRAQTFLDAIGDVTDEVPLASYEIVFVDYATPEENEPLSKVFKIPENIKRKIRFISVPQQCHYDLTVKLNTKMSFFEYIAKNIGIRRSLGEFILTTNPDNILSFDFFETISREDLNSGIVYRAIRWSMTETCKREKDEILNITKQPGLLKFIDDIKARCPTNMQKTVWFTSTETIKREANPCGAGDFLMLSKDMWHAVNGFDEFPGNMNVDALFLGRLMKFVPGYVRYILRSPIVHQYHPRQNIFRPLVPDHEYKMQDYACYASSKDLSQYESENWGLGNFQFNETRL